MFPVLPNAINKIPRRPWAQLKQEVVKIFHIKPVEQQRLRVLHRLFTPGVTLKKNALHGSDRKLGFSVKKVEEMAALGK